MTTTTEILFNNNLMTTLAATNADAFFVYEIVNGEASKPYFFGSAEDAASMMMANNLYSQYGENAYYEIECEKDHSTVATYIY